MAAPSAASLATVNSLLAEDDLDEREVERIAQALDRGDHEPLHAALKSGNERMAAQLAVLEKTSAQQIDRAPIPSTVPPSDPVVLPAVTVPAIKPTASFDDCLKRAEMARNQGLFSKALEWADQAIAGDAQKHHGWHAKAEALFGLEQFAESAAHAARALDLQPAFSPAWIRLAAAFDALAAPERALAAWDKAVELAGQNVLTWNGKGVCLSKLGRIEEALAVHDKSLAIDPRFSLGKFHKGMCEAHLGRKEAALKSLQQFLALAPPNLATLVQEARKRIQDLKV